MPSMAGNRLNPVQIAGWTNFVIVLLTPMVVLAVLINCTSCFHEAIGTTRLVSVASRILRQIPGFGVVAFVMLPFAALGRWRTSVHAQRYLCGESGWTALFESGVTFAVIALTPLVPGVITKPLQAPAYILVYGGGAFVLGTIVGFFLRLTAIISISLFR